MTKVIIKPTIHLSEKGMNDLFNLINDQYQKKDVVVVPYFCEVYVVDGNPELKSDSKIDFNDKAVKVKEDK